jgi:hypothetical protein
MDPRLQLQFETHKDHDATLVVRVGEAQNLRVCDVASGSSSPYVAVEMTSVRGDAYGLAKSPVRWRSSCASMNFDSEFSFDLEPVLGSRPDEWRLSLNVW